MEELRVDPEFRDKIPPLTTEEYRQLEENILRDGEVKRPLTVWKGQNVLVDGHNRWKIIHEHPEIPYKIEEIEFADKWAAFEWMYMNQLGQRNLSDYNKTYCIGKLYETRKHITAGAPTGNKNAQKQCDQNGSIESRPREREKLAEELHVGSGTIMRAAEFTRGVDAIAEIDPEMKNKILTGESKVTKQDIRAIGKAEPKERQRMIEQFKSGERVTPVEVPDKIAAKVQTGYNGGGTKQYRKDRENISEIVESMYDNKPIKYTLEDLKNEILWNAESYIKILKNTVEDHKQMIEQCRVEIRAYIEEEVISKIESIKEGI